MPRKINRSEKCKHQRDAQWCCECRYGKIKEDKETPERKLDLFDQITRKDFKTLINWWSLDEKD